MQAPMEETVSTTVQLDSTSQQHEKTEITKVPAKKVTASMEVVSGDATITVFGHKMETEHSETETVTESEKLVITKISADLSKKSDAKSAETLKSEPTVPTTAAEQLSVAEISKEILKSDIAESATTILHAEKVEKETKKFSDERTSKDVSLKRHEEQEEIGETKKLKVAEKVEKSAKSSTEASITLNAEINRYLFSKSSVFSSN